MIDSQRKLLQVMISKAVVLIVWCIAALRVVRVMVKFAVMVIINLIGWASIKRYSMTASVCV